MARNIFLQHKVKDLEDLTPIFTKAINKVDNRWALALGEKQNFNGQAGRSSFLMKKQDLSFSILCLWSAASRRSAIHYPIVLTGNSFSFVIFVINNQTAVGLLYHVRKFTEHNCFQETNPPPFSGTKNNPCPGTEDNCISCFMQRKLECK